MKKISQLKFLILMSLMLVISNAQATTIFVSTPTDALVGDNFDVDIFISDVNDFAGFDFELQFDNTLLSANSIISGDIFGFGAISNSNITPNTAKLLELTFAITGLDIVPSTLLATINFTANNAGNSSLLLQNVTISDSLGSNIIPVTILDSDILIIGVPSPASIWMLFLGLMIYSPRFLSKK